MDAKKCDRCGSYYDNDECAETEESSTNITVASYKCSKGPINIHDLCPDCAKKLYKWFSGKE